LNAKRTGETKIFDSSDLSLKNFLQFPSTWVDLISSARYSCIIREYRDSKSQPKRSSCSEIHAQMREKMKTRSLSVLWFRITRIKSTGRGTMAAIGLLLGLLAINGTASAAAAADAGAATTPNPATSSTTKIPPLTTGTAPATDTTGTQFATDLSGYDEVHFSGGGAAQQVPVPPATLRGAISTKATGKFSAALNPAGDIIDYELSYSGLEADVTQAHIHFGQRGTVGGIVVWLCQTAGTPAPEPVRDEKITPLCPGPRDGSIKGTITADQVLEVTDQGIAANEFDELVRALQNRTGYANVHTQTFRQGEIRGQIEAVDTTAPTNTSPTLR
jgi:hypothetical protein